MIVFILAVACLLLGARLIGRKLKHQEAARRQSAPYREVRDAVLTQRGLARLTEGGSMSDRMEWTLRISTFVGVLSYAEHYMGVLQPPDKRENPNVYSAKNGFGPPQVIVEHVLDEETAKRLSTDDFTYRAGWECGKFFSYEAVIERAKALFLIMAQPGEFLTGYLTDDDDEPTVLVRKEA